MNKLNTLYFLKQMAKSTTLLEMEKNWCKLGSFLTNRWLREGWGG